MRIGKVLLVISVLAASASVAHAHTTPYSWTAPKARVMLQDGTTIALPADQRASLDAELEALLDQFRRLAMISGDDPSNWRLTETYGTYVKLFQTAQNTVNAGLSIDAVECVGQGKALKGKRYKHFRCNATSYQLEIPDIDLRPGADPSLPEPVERPRRLIGPLEAVFTVHVMGKSRMLSQRAS
jgi:hypothetical protein